MNNSLRKIASLSESTAVENPPGIRRTALAYHKDIMLCHFSMKKGAEIPLHNHGPAQNGYIISGRVLFRKEDGSEFTAEAGTGYVFEPWEKHGAKVLEDSQVIEAFSPMRPEYSEEAARGVK